MNGLWRAVVNSAERLRRKYGETIDAVIAFGENAARELDQIENADDFIIDRARPREHMSFGFGIHRCLGNRLAELQLKILWQEILRKGLQPRAVGKPVYAYSNFLHAVRDLQVVIPA